MFDSCVPANIFSTEFSTLAYNKKAQMGLQSNDFFTCVVFYLRSSKLYET